MFKTDAEMYFKSHVTKLNTKGLTFYKRSRDFFGASKCFYLLIQPARCLGYNARKNLDISEIFSRTGTMYKTDVTIRNIVIPSTSGEFC